WNAGSFDFRPFHPRPDLACSLCKRINLVASGKARDMRIVAQPFECGANRAPLAVAKADAKHRAESDRNSFANLETLLGNLIVQYLRFSSPIDRSLTIARALPRSVSLTVTIAAITVGKAREETVLEFVQLPILFMHLVESLVVELLAPPSVDLVRKQ